MFVCIVFKRCFFNCTFPSEIIFKSFFGVMTQYELLINIIGIFEYLTNIYHVHILLPYVLRIENGISILVIIGVVVGDIVTTTYAGHFVNDPIICIGLTYL